jgi:hypothetical protein
LLTEVNKIFTDRFAPLGASPISFSLSWTSAEEDIEWASFLVVFDGVDFDQDEKPFSRTYFYLSMILLTFAELGALDLHEGMDRNEVMGVYNTANI